MRWRGAVVVIRSRCPRTNGPDDFDFDSSNVDSVRMPICFDCRVSCLRTYSTLYACTLMLRLEYVHVHMWTVYHVVDV